MKRIEKLTAEHLAIYLSYGLKITKDDWRKIFKVDYDGTTLNCVGVDYVLNVQAKPILRTRQSITTEELETFSICFRMWYDKPDFDYNLMVYSDIVQMAKLHIDIFGLIRNGLAVDKETLK